MASPPALHPASPLAAPPAPTAAAAHPDPHTPPRDAAGVGGAHAPPTSSAPDPAAAAAAAAAAQRIVPPPLPAPPPPAATVPPRHSASLPPIHPVAAASNAGGQIAFPPPVLVAPAGTLAVPLPALHPEPSPSPPPNTDLLLPSLPSTPAPPSPSGRQTPLQPMEIAGPTPAPARGGGKDRGASPAALAASGSAPLMPHASLSRASTSYSVLSNARDRDARRRHLKVTGALAVLVAACVIAIGVMAWRLARGPIAPSDGGSTPAPVPTPAPAHTKAMKTLADALMASTNASVDPCNNFYEFACGGWLGTARIPSDKMAVSRTFTTISDRNMAVLRELMDENWPLIAPLYRACMDETTIEGLGLSAYQPVISKIVSWANRSDVFALSGELASSIGVNLFWSAGVVVDIKHPQQYMVNIGEAGAHLPARSYYRDPNLLRAYREHIARMLFMTAVTDFSSRATATAAAGKIIALEQQIASISQSGENARSPEKQYNKFARDEVFGSAARWRQYTDALGLALPDGELVNVESPRFMELQLQLIENTPMPTLRAFALWSTVQALSNYLPKKFQTEAFEFWGRTLRGVRDRPQRWQQCTNLVAQSLPDLVGRYYVQRAFSVDAKAVSLDMIADVKSAWAAVIGRTEWMDAATRTAALGKLQRVTDKIGYPSKWTDYSELQLKSAEFMANAFRLAQFSWRLQAQRMRQNVSRDYWAMSADTVNAYYDPALNSINFPAGIIQPPFFTGAAPPAVNFGGIGSVMGHELGHGFDDQGRQFDASGRMVQWWSNSSIAAFVQRAQCFVDQYSALQINENGEAVWVETPSGGPAEASNCTACSKSTAALGAATSAGSADSGSGKAQETKEPMRINGFLTLGENIADNGGLRASYNAFKLHEQRHGADLELPALTGWDNERLFFLSYAQSWCQLQRADYTKLLLKSDPHSPNEARVLLPLSNFPAFAAAYSCPIGAKMNPTKRCDKLW